MSDLELCGVARSANQAISDINEEIQWLHTYITEDKAFCIYLANSEQTLLKHSELSGIPIEKVTQVSQVIDPLIANL